MNETVIKHAKHFSYSPNRPSVVSIRLHVEVELWEPRYDCIKHCVLVFKTLFYIVQVLRQPDTRLTWGFAASLVPRWRMTYQISTFTKKTSRGAMTFNIHKIAESQAEDAFRLEGPILERLELHEVASSTRKSWERRWNAYQKVFALIYAIHQIYHSSGGPGSVFGPNQRRMETPSFTTDIPLYSARVALENGDDVLLEALFHRLVRASKLAPGDTPIHDIATQPLHDPVPEGLSQVFKIPNIATGSISGWPEFPRSANFPWHSYKTENFVYANALVDGMQSYQLMTPRIVSLLASGWIGAQ